MKKKMYACFNRFQIKMTKSQALSASHPGSCDSDVAELVNTLRSQLIKLSPDDVAAELRDYGAWDDNELSDHKSNLQRIVWIAAADIADGRI